MRRTTFLLVLYFLAAPAARADHVQLGLRLPDGFEVTEFADSRLANDIFCMTLDARGRVVVSGRGYIRLLLDDDNDGKADRAADFADGPKDGAQGLLWEGTSLFFTGDGGLRRFRDDDGDDRADGPSELIRALKTGGEHDAHAIRRGPDGWLYVLCGNMTGIDRRFGQLPTSPIKEPVAGCVLRFTPDLTRSEIVADGFRNPYGMDFNGDGELFAYDSDNERCVSLPWYEPTRFYHVISGDHYGWQAPQHGQFWRQPPYFTDVVAPVAYLGRGSPTGVVCYRHTQFPAHYRGGMFLLDWTFGRVYFVRLAREGASYRGQPDVFLESVGDNGFAPTAAAVHPTTGDLYLAIGGRGTRGAVYRVRYPRGLPGKSLGRPPATSLEWHSVLRQELPRLAKSSDPLQRLRAFIALRRHRREFPPAVIQEAVRAAWDVPDRSLRQAAAALIATLDEADREALGKSAVSAIARATYCLGTCEAVPDTALPRACRLVETDGNDRESMLAAVRAVQRALGDLAAPAASGTVWEGYSARHAVGECGRIASAVLARRFPTGQADVDRELSRTLAMLEDDHPRPLRAVAHRLTANSDPLEDIHHLIVLARLKAPRPAEITTRVAGTLLALDRKLAAKRANRDRNWPLRIAETYAELARKDTELHEAILNHAEFGRPDHALFARAPGFPRRRAAEIFLARAEKQPEFVWNADLVELLDALAPDQSLPVLRRLWGQAGLDAVILPLLARHARPEDRDRFREGLASPQMTTVRLCLEALKKLPPRADGSELLALVRTFRALGDSKEEVRLRKEIARYLRRVTGAGEGGDDKQAWTEWFTRTYPDLAPRLGGTDGVDVAAWGKRLAAVSWQAGNAGRGLEVFTRAACASCHSGAQALGPDLRGVAGRFSRADLFTAVVQPSKDISPRYRTTSVETADGKVYQGLVIYEAVDSLILQTGPAATVRLTNPQIAGRRYTDRSLMPAGLLDKCSDRDLADLYAYLKSLK